MSQHLPEQIDPFRLARQRRVITGELAVRRMSRLLPLVTGSDDAMAQVALEFGTDDMGVRFIRGQVKATLAMICQRCLQPMAQTVESRLALGLVTNQRDADLLPTHYDPLLVEHDHIVLLDMVEDELLLALPIVATHPAGACAAVAATELINTVEEKKSSPFTVLEQLKPRESGNK